MLSVLVTGCGGKSVKKWDKKIDLPKSVTVPQEFSKKTEVIKRDEPGDEKSFSGLNRWWFIFEDENLNKLMEDAFLNNLDIKAAYARLDKLVAIRRSSISKLFPSVNASASGVTASETTVKYLDGTEVVTENDDTASYGLTASYEVDLFGKNIMKARAEHFNLLATKEDIKALYISLTANIATLYYRAVEQRAQVHFAETTLNYFADNLKLVESRYKAGLVSPLDLYQARQNLSQEEATLPEYKEKLALIESELSVLLGRYPDGNIYPSKDGDINLPSGIPVFDEGLPSELLKRRPDIEASHLRLKAIHKQVGSAVADRFPSLNIGGSIIETITDPKVLIDATIFQSLTASVILPLFDGGRKRAEVKRLKAVFNEELSKHHKVILNAFKEVEDSLVKNRLIEERVEKLAISVEAAEGAFRVSTERYKQGLIDYLPVLTAQTSYIKIQAGLLSAQRELVIDRIELVKSLGGNWTEEVISERLRKDK